MFLATVSVCHYGSLAHVLPVTALCGMMVVVASPYNRCCHHGMGDDMFPLRALKEKLVLLRRRSPKSKS